ncbi:apolipoprotein N-acyltransferase [uncultured Tateyamaria sp.]|uniref:apolipoprotein N-acyltransferase n=1 Tax=uncultured Tateyamaria sp. TaxID=455651 RepID=UPI002629796B|nr:apolipoprotein N-acyltransferase [uncultured Tateyamaria sp.]
MTPQVARFGAWPSWVQLCLALCGGAAGALAHAPFDLAPFILLPMLAGFALLRAARSTLRALTFGWALGWAYFALTLNWITEPFQVDAATTGWMAPFALVLLALLLGAFWALALAFAKWAGGRTWMLVLAWTGAEMLRAYLFTGFPWAMLPQTLIDVHIGQSLAWAGPHGVTAALLGVAGLIMSAQRLILSGAGAIVATIALLIPVVQPPDTLTGHTVRLVQPNAPQTEKWDPALIPVFVDRQIDATAAGPAPDLVVWPETALPYLLENATPVLEAAAQAARGAPVVLGIQRRDDRGAYYNSLAVLGAGGRVAQTYDKHHLVPFGEYMPFKWLFRNMGIRALAERSDTGYAAGPGPRLLDFGPLGAGLPLICYEAVFAHDVGGTPSRPAFLMQLTNDAWFGARSGPQQHLAQARMRAIEQGLPMMRAANTGISAMIDTRGRITKALPLNTAGYIDAPLPAPGAQTLYARMGDLPWVVLVLAGLIVAVLHRARTRRTQHIDGTPPSA